MGSKGAFESLGGGLVQPSSAGYALPPLFPVTQDSTQQPFWAAALGIPRFPPLVLAMGTCVVESQRRASWQDLVAEIRGLCLQQPLSCCHLLCYF